jgi:hypothetical protein
LLVADANHREPEVVCIETQNSDMWSAWNRILISLPSPRI